MFSGMSALNGNFTSLISSVMFPMLTSKFTEKERKEYENRRYVRYNEYLSEIQNQIETVQAMELQDLNENNPSEDDLFRFLPSRRRLWERRPVHQDFLRLRIGKGKVPLKSEIQYPSRSFGVDEDSLALKMYGLVEQDYALTDAPITVDFIEDYICGVRGSLQRKLSLFYRLLFQICYLHASEELKIILVMDRDMLEENPFLKFLPHIWDDRQEFRWIITSEADAAEASKRLSERVEEAQKRKAAANRFWKTRRTIWSSPFRRNCLNPQNRSGQQSRPDTTLASAFSAFRPSCLRSVRKSFLSKREAFIFCSWNIRKSRICSVWTLRFPETL
ncbi:hypothetical protein [Allobaculum sp. Allo2]|uniref:hypothetical protein n=1 Tax=Allobaculum sp. Allo2 TaxID=2853432 RepID=UPI001F60A79C|nr:hypothetical protein [Allobaculum sp. Allo2]UNT92933.1 hypothetical protein KWG61_12850 [Allobaculum sp. Allo2]